MREQEIAEMARKLLPESYTDSWQEKQQLWIAGATWADENGIIEDLKSDIRKLKDELSDLEYKHEEELNKLQDIIKDQDSEIRELEKQLADRD